MHSKTVYLTFNLKRMIFQSFESEKKFSAQKRTKLVKNVFGRLKDGNGRPENGFSELFGGNPVPKPSGKWIQEPCFFLTAAPYSVHGMKRKRAF